MSPRKTAQQAPDDVDTQMMTLALAEGDKGHPSPNPHVGAVVARGKEVLAAAHHDRAGDDHAEVRTKSPAPRCT